MAQDYIKINGVKIWQPDCDIAVALETTYTQGSTKGTVWKREIYTDVYGRAFPVYSYGYPNVRSFKNPANGSKRKTF